MNTESIKALKIALNMIPESQRATTQLGNAEQVAWLIAELDRKDAVIARHAGEIARLMGDAERVRLAAPVSAAAPELPPMISRDVIDSLVRLNNTEPVSDAVPQSLAGTIVLLETFARIGMTAERDGQPTQNALLCLRFAAELRALAADPKVAWPDVALPVPTAADDLQFNATRLRNVVRLMGMESEVPQDDATLDGARGSVLGRIAAKLREGRAPTVTAMVNRFLGWPLPKDFSPDCGISFDGRKDDEWNKNKTWPVGTNMLSADQAKAMFEHCLTATDAAPGAAQEGPDLAWLPMESAPKDGTMLRLLVAFTDNATEDSAAPSPTIGANSFANTGIDRWQFAGWNWQQDCFTEGAGTPVGWLPLASPAAPVGALPGGQVEAVEPHVDVALPALQPGQSWCCGGCGSGVVKNPKRISFEYSREEFPDGRVISKTAPQYVAPCCGGELTLWDDNDQDYKEWSYVATPSSSQDTATNLDQGEKA